MNLARECAVLTSPPDDRAQPVPHTSVSAGPCSSCRGTFLDRAATDLLWSFALSLNIMSPLEEASSGTAAPAQGCVSAGDDLGDGLRRVSKGLYRTEATSPWLLFLLPH